MTEADVARLALSSLHSFGPSKVCKSFSMPIDPSLNADESMEELVAELSGGSNPFSLADLRAAISDARRTVDHSDNLGIDILSLTDPRYPEPLKRIPKPAPFLHVRGALPEDWSYAVAVIGTREISEAAVGAIDEIVQALSLQKDVIVVSGLAFGADTKAHEASLRYDLRTVAVLAHGLDQPVYPKQNADLAKRILDEGGCWISELRVGEKVVPYNLVARDRLQSGLSIATIVAQTSVSGGSMHTALFTLQQNRTLIALQPPATATHDPEWLGNTFLTSLSITPAGVKRADDFAKHPRPYARKLLRENISAWIEKALQARFIPVDRADRSTAASTSDGSRQAALFHNGGGSTSEPIPTANASALNRAGNSSDESVSAVSVPNDESSEKATDQVARQKVSTLGRNGASVAKLPGSAVRNAESQTVHTGRLALRLGYAGVGGNGSGVRVADTVACARTLSESLASPGMNITLMSDSGERLSSIDVSFQPSVAPDVALVMLRRTFGIVSAICVTKGYAQLYEVSVELFDEENRCVVFERGGSNGAVKHPDLAPRDCVISASVVNLFGQFDDVLRMSSDVGGFFAAYSLLDRLLILWKLLSISAKKLNRQRDIKLPEVRLHELKTVDAGLTIRKYSDLLKHYKPLLKADGRKESLGMGTARRVLETALLRLLGSTKVAVQVLEAAGERIVDTDVVGVAASRDEPMALALLIDETRAHV